MKCFKSLRAKVNIHIPKVWIDPSQASYVVCAFLLASFGLFLMLWLSTKVPQGIAPYQSITLFYALSLLISSIVLIKDPKHVIPISMSMLFLGMIFVFTTVLKSLFYPPVNPIYAVTFLSACTNYVLVLLVVTYATLQKGARFFGWFQCVLLSALVLFHWLTDQGTSHPSTIVPRVVLLFTPLICLVSLDFLVRRRDEAASKEVTTQLEKEKHIAMMSHEIRGQLQTTLSTGELLSSKVSDPIAKRALIRLNNVTLHLDRYLRDWVEFVRLENPELSIECKHFNLITLVDQVIEDYKTVAIDQGLVIIGPMWSTLPANVRLNWQTAQGDAVRVQQVLRNLIDNALKYTSEGTIQVTISAPVERVQWACISVADSGPGIAAEDLALVFQPFLRLRGQHNSLIKGSGLGLAIAWRLMQRMNGKLEASSQLGKGSTFTMRFPLQPR